MSLSQHGIAETGHRILNPFTEEKLRLLGEVSHVISGTRVLDLACGKAELLCLWATWFGSVGVGVDLSHVFTAAARARVSQLGVADRVEIVQGDAAGYVAEPEAFDIVSCLGATWIGDGIGGTVDLMRPALRPGGRILIGEPYWIEAPSSEALAAFGWTPDDFTDLAGTARRIEGAGMELVEMVLADGDAWDRYEASQWSTITDWLAANPDDPDHASMRLFRDHNRDRYLRWGRRHLGWGVFVTRPR